MKMEKKKFIYPEAIVIEFNNNDVIATSGPGEGPDQEYDDWGRNWFGN